MTAADCRVIVAIQGIFSRELIELREDFLSRWDSWLRLQGWMSRPFWRSCLFLLGISFGQLDVP